MDTHVASWFELAGELKNPIRLHGQFTISSACPNIIDFFDVAELNPSVLIPADQPFAAPVIKDVNVKAFPCWRQGILARANLHSHTTCADVAKHFFFSVHWTDTCAIPLLANLYPPNLCRKATRKGFSNHM
jgi:hypothetical protein